MPGKFMNVKQHQLHEYKMVLRGIAHIEIECRGVTQKLTILIRFWLFEPKKIL